ncbi:MltG/YceG/YrrL family protein [Bilifractor porci]|jgi:cell division protein YceG involved in septum cleavage|uniref:Endolytic transglycosylase MltG n=1 Tax=Bilifractor porci TaxID=2606636 RepID=A0A7X2P7Y5_9FIRM|nr:endolytic transglycosylase MltG [Bilifractor porci]MST81796.1 endolytic transglycosylase MltG [Bilifractor porci]
MAGKEKKDNVGYRVALFGVKGLLKVLLIVCLVVVLIYFCKKAYGLGYEVFNQDAVDSGDGRKVTVTVTEDMSVYDIGKMLRAEGLLEESPAAFWVQELISDYHNQILPGTYSLNTAMTPDDIISALAGSDSKHSVDGGETVISSSGQEQDGSGSTPEGNVKV